MKYKIINNNFENFILDIDNIFSNKKNITLFDKRNVIKIIEYDNNKYVVKSFKVPHFINKIVYRFFRDSKAKRSYENSVKLQELKINTPKPIGYIEQNSFFFFKKSYYISEYFDYDFEIRVVFKDKKFDDRENLLEEFIKFTASLHDKGVYHIDYSPGNILVKKINEEYQFYIIDVNRMKFIEYDDDMRMKSLSKLTKNVDDNKLLVKYYAKVLGLDKQMLFVKLKYYLDKEYSYLKNKKRLKKLKG